MNYAVIIEQHNGAYRAVIPALSNLTAEGPTRHALFLKRAALLKATCPALKW